MPEALFRCPRCKAFVQLKVDGRHFKPLENEEDPHTWLLFGHCVRCNQAGIVEEIETGPDQWDREIGAQIYPPATRSIDFALPPLVEESFQEAIKCESIGAPLATAVMVRRTLEAIARQFDPSAKNLFRGLHAMKEKGLISEELAQWGDQLRFIGNIGAHPTDEDKVTMQDAREAVEFLNAIVETIYHLRPKFQAMQARRQAKKAKPKPPPNPDESSEEEES